MTPISLAWIGDWFDRHLDMHLDFTGDLMTPDWSVGDGDPVLRPERKPVPKYEERYLEIQVGSVKHGGK